MIPTVHKCEPAYSVLERLGGKGPVSAHLGLDRSTLSRWCSERPGGTGGMIPQQHWPKLLSMARRYDIRIKLADLAGMRG